ncbi:hypothetical protein NMY3_02864 [Candidatus Nitrosocosmicus oleophilus]|uniref:Uncharacterized protein n=2 Tax=Candidatus Nitrosocosmicus oleophilus TaxID=1353260 RepID=A0A654M321_9ARCH|nr:hypothetical protein NMY3_02864 [Candidatus Nitrosocosmicus oleophilus]
MNTKMIGISRFTTNKFKTGNVLIASQIGFPFLISVESVLSFIKSSIQTFLFGVITFTTFSSNSSGILS